VFRISRLSIALVIATALSVSKIAFAESDATEYVTKAKQAESQLDFGGAIIWYEKAAELDDAEAMNQLGWIYFGAYDVRGRHFRDYSKAAIWFQKAANLNYIPAVTQLGVMHNSDGSFGLPEDHVKAARLFLKAAQAGNAQAMNNLAVMYAQGKGVRRDFVQAIYWWKKAVDTDKTGPDGKAAQSWLSMHGDKQ
jgi:TPR repeat protein